ncbi:Glutamyl-tRNA(Gln) amidotransferase subunit E [Candidatus Gugararchaeum adminiculabundum]|nr:Glutamyl-tRNA(Gln) amidotransferase subunit E [Candidatus Gugararchaeum adminiculabundum]
MILMNKLKCGIEIHQRLVGRGEKLFCSCPSEFSEDAKPLYEVIRRQHTVVSELGETDAAAQFEALKKKIFVYQVFENDCAVELDEEPPHEMNPYALASVVEICNQLNCKVVDEVQVMRKTVIDGSNTSGFQRTAIVGMNGWLESSQGRVSIQTVCIEEESAGIVSQADDGSGRIVYRLDRLGVPLVEIATGPEIVSGKHCLEVAKKVGDMMRNAEAIENGIASNKEIAQRGIGTIRQDLNVSVEGGARVEIKGAQQLGLLEEWVESEANRQKKMLEVYEEIVGKKAEPASEKEIIDLTDAFTGTQCGLISKGVSAGAKVLGMRMKHFAGILGKEVQKERRFGSELSDYAKAAGVKGIIHSDEDLAKYKISEGEVAKLREKLKVEGTDAFVLVVEKEKIAHEALKRVIARAKVLSIPGETRRALPNGSSAYMRPIPGRARMYPETDIPPALPANIFRKGVTKVEVRIISSEEIKKELIHLLKNEQMADRILKGRNLFMFQRLADEFEPMVVATTLEETLVALRREGVEFEEVKEVVGSALELYKKEKIVKAAIPDVLRAIAKGETVEGAAKKFARIKEKELEKLAKEKNYDVGAIMREFRLNIDASELQEILKKKK